MKRLALLLLALPTFALAQDDEEAPPRNVLYQKATEIDFTEVDVNAALNRPSIQITFEARRTAFNFIRLRSDFSAELDDSVGEVK